MQSRGVEYNFLSAQSKKLFGQIEIQQFIKNNYEELKRGDYKNRIINIEFTNKGIFKWEDSDAYYALQHCKLCNPIITEDGYFQAKIVDYYDFDRREGGETIKQKTSKEINNWGHSMQEKGYLENFFVVYYINEKL